MIFTIALLLGTGCNDAADLQKTANKAQNDADAKIDAAQAGATKESREAQAAADKTIAKADADFQALRESYRHERTTSLATLDTKVAALDAKALAAKGSDKEARDARLKVIRANREAFIKGYEALDSTDATRWDGEKASLEARWITLQASVDQS